MGLARGRLSGDDFARFKIHPPFVTDHAPGLYFDYLNYIDEDDEAAKIQLTDESGWKQIPKSQFANNSRNPIYDIFVEKVNDTGCAKKPIRMHLGDPTLGGNLPPSNITKAAMHKVIDSDHYNSYFSSVGMEDAREAVVRLYSTPEAPFKADDVILTSGCSHALQLSLVALADVGDNVLVPRPGFPLYASLCRSHNIDVIHYPIDMTDGLIDLSALDELINEKTKAIVVNNPSNPTGITYPKEHLEAILEIASRHKVAIISDEIYGGLVFNGAEFHPIASLSPKVPIITCDGTAKRYFVPGWRLGWAIVHNRFDVLTDVKKGIVSLSQRIMGPNSLVEAALPQILADNSQSNVDHTRQVLEKNAQLVHEMLSDVEGLRVLMSTGALYIMVQVDPQLYGPEMNFVRDLGKEQCLYVMPCSALGLPNWIRILLTFPDEVTRDACERIVEYCESNRHDTKRLR